MPSPIVDDSRMDVEDSNSLSSVELENILGPNSIQMVEMGEIPLMHSSPRPSMRREQRHCDHDAHRDASENDPTTEVDSETEEYHVRLPSYSAVCGPPPEYDTLTPPYAEPLFDYDNEDVHIPAPNTRLSDSICLVILTWSYIIMVGAILVAMFLEYDRQQSMEDPH